MPSTATPSPPHTIPVFISGAGPVGLYEALLLTQLGIPVRIIEREARISPDSRALGLHARTMEIFQFTGIVDPFQEQGKRISEVHYYSNARLVGAMPVIQAPEHSKYSSLLILEQAATSEIILKKLRALGVEVEYGWELLDTKVVEGGVEGEEDVETTIRRVLKGDNVIRGGTGPNEEQKGKENDVQVVRSKYLVACDGGRSTVRHKINIGFPGRTLSHKSLMWDGYCECDIPLTEFS
jgi:2-polyprenyl-6-methoxyphenol hydroxylase-like FAD-dependent oxidoreductase